MEGCKIHMALSVNNASKNDIHELIQESCTKIYALVPLRSDINYPNISDSHCAAWTIVEQALHLLIVASELMIATKEEK
jgi:hypothetical protein